MVFLSKRWVLGVRLYLNQHENWLTETGGKPKVLMDDFRYYGRDHLVTNVSNKRNDEAHVSECKVDNENYVQKM